MSADGAASTDTLGSAHVAEVVPLDTASRSRTDHPRKADGSPYAVSYHSFYRLRCRCADCRAWNARRQREKGSRNRSQRLTIAPPRPTGHPRNPKTGVPLLHGYAAYVRHGCRCEGCEAWKARTVDKLDRQRTKLERKQESPQLDGMLAEALERWEAYYVGTEVRFRLKD